MNEAAERWFASRGWSSFTFQREVWAAMADGRSGLLYATTGSGKTFTVWLGAVARGLAMLRDDTTAAAAAEPAAAAVAQAAVADSAARRVDTAVRSRRRRVAAPAKGYLGAPKSMKQLQASSSLFYEVFRKYDSANLLLGQAESEVLSQEIDIARLTTTLEAIDARRIDFVELTLPSPMSLPLMVERFREKLTTEKRNERLERMLRDMNAAIDDPSSERWPARRHRA